MKQIILGLLLLSLLNTSIFAQGEGAMPVMTMQRSLQLIGAGNIGVAKPNNDPIGYYLNPAILGYTSQNNHASLFIMPDEKNWSGSSSVNYNTFGFNIGYNLKDFDIPISIRFGYMYDIAGYITHQMIDQARPEISPYDSFNNFSFGIGIDYHLLFNFGVSIKAYDSDLYSHIANSKVGNGRAEGTAFDYGIMIITPISKLFFDDVIFDFGNSSIKPTMNFTVGYSLTNVGDEIFYFDEAQSNPLSRTARLGYTFDFGFDTFINENKLNLFTYAFTAEVEDILINQKPCPNGRRFCYPREFDSYQSFLGDIDITKHLIKLEWDENVMVHIGHTFNIFETITFTFGGFAGWFYSTEFERIEPETKSIGISSEGISKLWSASNNNTILNYIAKHIVLEYYSATQSSWLARKEMHGISLHMNNIEL